MDRRSFLIGTARAGSLAGPAFAQEAFPVARHHHHQCVPARRRQRYRDAAARRGAGADPQAAGGGRDQGRRRRRRSARSSPPAPSPTATPCCRTTPASPATPRSTSCSAVRPRPRRADFIPLARLIADPCVLLVNEQQPYKTLKEFIDAAKANPDTIIFSSGGLYGATHLPLAMLEKAVGGLKLRHLPTNGGGPAITAILGNNAQVTRAVGVGHAAAHQGRQAAAAGLFGATRSKALPDVPTLKELGYDVEYYLWVGMFAPKGTPANVTTTCARPSTRRRNPTLFKTAHDQSRPGARLSRRAGLPEVLGRRRQAHRRSGESDRPRVRQLCLQTTCRNEPASNRGEIRWIAAISSSAPPPPPPLWRRRRLWRKRPIRRTPSPSSARFRPAASATPSRARSMPRWRRCSSSRSCSKTRPAPPARSARNLPPPPSPTATRCSSHIVSISGFAAVDKLFGRTPKFTNANFIPIARIIADPIVLIVNDDPPYKTLKDLVADAKANPEQGDLFLVRPLRRLAHPDRAVRQGGRRPEDAPSADQWRRPGRHRRARRQRQLLHVADLDRAVAYQGRQGAAAGGVRAPSGSRRCPTCRPSRSRLRSRILFLGRHFRAQGHARADHQDAARRPSTRPRTARNFSTRSPISARNSPIWTSRNSPSSGPPTPSGRKTPSTASAACRDDASLRRPRSREP